MAQKTIVSITDDLDGSTASATLSFGLDGVAYEIDLSKRNAAALRNLLSPYIECGRRARVAPQRGRSGKARNRDEIGAIRAWAKASGYIVADRGRIAADIVEAYNGAPEA